MSKAYHEIVNFQSVQQKGEVLIVTLRRKLNRFEHNMLDILLDFSHFYFWVYENEMSAELQYPLIHLLVQEHLSWITSLLTIVNLHEIVSLL